MNLYLDAFSIFFKIGAFTIGGGYAMVPLIEDEIVTRRGWLAKEDFIDLLAIAQSSPGILAVNISIFIGYLCFSIISRTMLWWSVFSKGFVRLWWH